MPFYRILISILVCALTALAGESKKPVHVKHKDGTASASYLASARSSDAVTAPPGATSAGKIRRDSRGRIVRSSTAKAHFEDSHPCPSTRITAGSCPGYVVDHIKPLACGGRDEPANMQWQSAAEAKAKDRVERIGCAAD